MKRPVLGFVVIVLAMALGVLPASAQQAKGAPVEIGVGYFPSWNGGWSGTVIKKKSPNPTRYILTRSDAGALPAALVFVVAAVSVLLVATAFFFCATGMVRTLRA